ncbi:porin family protein [Halomonas sp. LBP4]|uniref:porin family protein n=1 Tax=Halomonas sp. LBP4 TaxID=2044917 RepID=UPI000D768CE2|nr:porin family protein [Halomonas sp. LBP4]PXX94772.1 hypothetical protein CR157_21350 [Halomonas sp. LBP4]
MKTLAISSVSALLVAGACASTALAQQPMSMQPYIGGDAMFWELDRDRGPDRDSVGVRLRGGAQFNDYFAAEGHLGTGGSDGGIELDYLVGAYAKGILPLGDTLRLYGLLGYTEVDFDVDREGDFSYGAGGEFDVAPNLAIGADYMRYLDKSNHNFDAASIGLTYRF